MLVSNIQQSGSVTQIFFRFFSITGYYKILSIAPCTIQQIFVVFYFFLISLLRNKLKGLLSPFTEYVWIFHSWTARSKNNSMLFKLFKREKYLLSLGLFSFLMLFFMANIAFQFSSVSQSCLTLRPHGLQQARPPCPSPTPRVYSNSWPLPIFCLILLGRPSSESPTGNPPQSPLVCQLLDPFCNV